MKSAEERVREFWTDQDREPWPMLVKLVDTAMRDTLEAAAKVCDGRRRDLADESDAADARGDTVKAMVYHRRAMDCNALGQEIRKLAQGGGGVGGE